MLLPSLKTWQNSSPFHSIPNEILQIIFEYCCDTNHFSTDGFRNRKPVLYVRSVALVVSSVNSRWRRNAIDMPRIWSRIKLEWLGTAGYGQLDEESFFSLITVLDRSFQLPLVIDLHHIEDSGDYVHPMLKKLLTLHMHRFQSFTFHARFYILDSFFDSPPEFPQLTSVHSGGLTISASDAPRIQRLTSEHIIYFNDSPPFPYSQLLHLNLVLPSRKDMERFPSEAVRLRSLELQDVHGFPAARGDLQPTTCPFIETLAITINHFHKGESCSVFPYLTLPALETLSLIGMDSLVSLPNVCLWPNYHPLIGFIERSSSPLTSLLIERVAISDTKLVQLLSLLPMLADLTVSDVDIPNRFSPITEHLIESLQALRDNRQSDTLIPRLRYLRLYTWANGGFDDASVVDMVRSRWIPGARSAESPGGTVACIREFTFSFNNREKVSDGVYEPLEAFEREGLRAVVLWKN